LRSNYYINMSLFKTFTKVHHHEPYASISPSLPALSTAGRSVVITGGGSGIGPRIANAFAQSGSTQIVILGRTESTLERTKAELEAKYEGLKVLAFVADIVDGEAVARALSSAKAEFGPLDILVANAGYLPELELLADTDINEWAKGFDVNVKGNLLLCRGFLANASEHPTLVHVSTSVAHVPCWPKYSGYAVSKLAALKLFEAIQAENPHATVFNVHPGILETDMQVKSRASGLDITDLDHLDLPGHFINWIVSPEAEFLKGKLVWSNWDADELKARRAEIEGTSLLTIGLQGWGQ
jgi:NAD(P)-dependent dehydrogenase (short-subunit alcohol dehydrogenase family)